MTESYRKRMQQVQESDISDDFVADPDALAIAPSLADLMCRYRLDDRGLKTATVAVWCDDGHWKCRITDRETEMTLWHTLTDPKCLYQELEERLLSPNPEWKVARRSHR